MPFFSTIIPCYDRADLIAKTVDSVLAQQFTDQEVIVVDDGSTDGTLEVLSRYGSRVRVLQQANKGPGAARNLGCQHATGEYIACLDSDDLWFPWTLAIYKQALDENGRPAFLSCKQFVFHDEGELGRITCGALQVEIFADYYASSDGWRWFGASSFVLRADVVRQVGGFTNERVICDDADMAMRLGTAGRFVHIKAPYTFAYRQHNAGLKASAERFYQGVCYLLQQEAKGSYPGGVLRRHQRWEILTRHARPASLICLRDSKVAEGWALYKATLVWNLRLARWRYVSAFPLLALAAALRSQR